MSTRNIRAIAERIVNAADIRRPPVQASQIFEAGKATQDIKDGRFSWWISEGSPFAITITRSSQPESVIGVLYPVLIKGYDGWLIVTELGFMTCALDAHAAVMFAYTTLVAADDLDT